MRTNYLFILLSMSGLLGGLSGAGQRPRIDDLTPHFHRDSCYWLQVPQTKTQARIIRFDEQSVAGIALQCARRYGYDSIGFVRPIDSSKSYLGGGAACRVDAQGFFAGFCEEACYYMYPQGNKLYVWLHDSTPLSPDPVKWPK